MDIQLMTCTAQRPDRRAIAKMLEDIAGLDRSLATELTDILLDGSPVDITLTSKSTSSAFRALRKLEIEYEIV